MYKRQGLGGPGCEDAIEFGNQQLPMRHALGIGREACICSCLLYTSDAADERSSVDLGGRRIIKKKTIEGDGVERIA